MTPFDLTSGPDEDTRHLRDQLQKLSLASVLVSPIQMLAVNAGELRATAAEALDTLASLLLLRRCLIALMQATSTEALALPFDATVLASTISLRVRVTPDLPNILQVLLPGEGLVTVSDSAYAAPEPGHDSEGDSEAGRYRAALQQALDALEAREGVERVEGLLRATLRT